MPPPTVSAPLSDPANARAASPVQKIADGHRPSGPVPIGRQEPDGMLRAGDATVLSTPVGGPAAGRRVGVTVTATQVAAAATASVKASGTRSSLERRRRLGGSGPGWRGWNLSALRCSASAAARARSSSFMPSLPARSRQGGARGLAEPCGVGLDGSLGALEHRAIWLTDRSSR